MQDTADSLPRDKRQTIATVAWAVLGIFLVAYGLVALNAGTKLSPSINADGGQETSIGYILEQTQQGTSMVGEPETQVLPFWINLMAQWGSVEYAYGPDGILETEQQYHLMDSSRRHVLSTHMMLGLVIMATGFLQFWPAFRRKHRTAHRRIGALYIATALGSMSMSAYFLLRTGPDATFNGFVFFSGLWLLLILSVFSIGMAMWSLKKRQIAMHLGWQALAFACFLSAPIQRVIWVGMSPIAGDASFNEMNIMVNATLFTFCFLAGYGIFYANRESAPRRAEPSPAALDQPLMVRLILGVWLIGSWLQAAVFYLISGGLSGSEVAQRLAPAEATLWHDAVLGSVAPALLVLSVGLFLALALRLLLMTGPQTLPAPRIAAAMSMSATLAAGIFLQWGIPLGMPSHEHSVAGVFYTALGVVLLGFIGLFIYGYVCGQVAKAREWLWFAVLLSVAPGILYGQMLSLDLIGMIPEHWSHHGYQIAAAVGLSLPILVGHLLAVYSQWTREHAVS